MAVLNFQNAETYCILDTPVHDHYILEYVRVHDDRHNGVESYGFLLLLGFHYPPYSSHYKACFLCDLKNFGIIKVESKTRLLIFRKNRREVKF